MRALVLVDLQNDFLPGGALAVPHGDEVVPVANRVQRHFAHVLATQDWHPSDHGSFASRHPGRRPGDVITLDGLRQELWPDHCIQGTPGAELTPFLDRTRLRRVFRKGVDRDVDSYSTFFDNGHRRSTGLAEHLTASGVDEVFLLGLATDYCVLYSARDAHRLGFAVSVIVDGCRAIDVRPGDGARALEELRRLGVHLVLGDDVPSESAEHEPGVHA